MQIAAICDAAYVPWTGTMLQSVLEVHSRGSVRFHVFGISLSPSDVEKLEGLVARAGGEIEVHQVSPERVAGYPAVDRFGRSVWVRFLLPELLPDGDRVLYLDADTFVVDGLEQLWETSLAGPIGAVPNVVEPRLHDHVRSLGVADPRRFFNSGVLLMDLAAMRSEDTLGLLDSFLDRGTSPRWPDQDALNWMFAGRWTELDPRWNAMNSLWTWRGWADDVYGPDAAESARRHPAIIHFEGPTISKPWHRLCPHPWTERYRQVLSRTPWSDVGLVGHPLYSATIGVLPKRYWLPAYVRVERARHRLSRLAQRR